MHRVSCKSLRGSCSQMPPTTCIKRTRRWRVALAICDLLSNLQCIKLEIGDFFAFLLWLLLSDQGPRIVPSKNRHSAMLSDAAVKCVSASVCTVPETLHALYTMLLQENTPVLGKLFRPPWRLSESIRLCDNQTPDTRQLASGDHQEIETLLGQFRLDLSSSSFQDDSDTKGQVLQGPE